MAIRYNTSLAHYSYLVIVYVFRLLILEIYRMPIVVRLINAREFLDVCNPFINV